MLCISQGGVALWLTSEGPRLQLQRHEFAPDSDQRLFPVHLDVNAYLASETGDSTVAGVNMLASLLWSSLIMLTLWVGDG